MRNPVRFEIDMGDVELRSEGEAVFDASRVIAVAQLRSFDGKNGMVTCTKRCRLMFDGVTHDMPIVLGSIDEVTEKLQRAMRSELPEGLVSGAALSRISSAGGGR